MGSLEWIGFACGEGVCAGVGIIEVHWTSVNVCVYICASAIH